MPKVVKRMEGGYLGPVTPPQGRGSHWTSPGSLPLAELMEALRRLGCHDMDIAGAITEADPEWRFGSAGQQSGD